MSLRTIQPRVAGVTAASNLALLVVMVIASWLALAKIEREVREETGQALDTVLETSNGALVVWARHRWANADELAKDPRISAAVGELLRGPREREHILASPRLAELRRLFIGEGAHHEHEGFLVIAPDGVNVAAMHDAEVGRRSVIADQRPEVFARALGGESVLVPPLRSDIPLRGSDGRLHDAEPTMFVAAPVTAADGKVLGVLALRLDPHGDFERLIELGRVGESGETYVFDGEGRVLTRLRGTDELRAAGLLDEDGNVILSVRVGDPGGDLRQGHKISQPLDALPLTRAAAGATSHGRDRDIEGYRDYRGVRVLGAWTWNDELGVGLTSEVDEEEALQAFYSMRRWVYLLVVVTAVLSIVLTWLMFWTQARATRALAEREDRLLSILDTALDGIITVDARGCIETFNAAAEAMFDYQAEEVVGQDLSKLVPGVPSPDELVARGPHTGEDAHPTRIDREAEGLRKDGTTFPLELGFAAVVTGRDGARPRFTGVLRDITERKSLEARFLQSQKLQAVGQLAAGVAHDFNNLLMGVSGSARVALNRIDDRARVQQLLEEIRGATVTGAAITRQLLTMTRTKGGRLVEVELDAAVGLSRSVLGRLIGEDVELEVELGAPGSWVRCGDGHIEQLVINLVVNARDAMPKGGTIEIRTSEREVEPGLHTQLAPGRYLVLEVRDTGVGMDDEIRERIFEPFFTTKEAGKGTGLGLSTVYGIVSRGGGTIEVDSKLGEGTTFRVLLPRIEASAHEPAAPSAVQPLPPMTVLVVEDEALVRDTIRHYLRTAGHRVLVAAGRREARSICEAHTGPIDVLVTDVVLRGESGADVATDLRARDPAIIVVFMSAHPAEYLWKTGRLAEGTAVLQKPFELEELEAWLRSVVTTTVAAEPEAEPEPEPESAEPLAVLLVEDQAATRMATAELLQDEGFRVLTASNGTEAEQIYDTEQGQVVVVTDLGLPDVPGDALVRRLAAKHPLRGVVFVSGRDEEDPAVGEALGHPRTAFLQKPVDLDALIEQIRRVSRAS